VTVFSGDNIGLGLPGDDLDAFSFNRSNPIATTDFALLFSVSRAHDGRRTTRIPSSSPTMFPTTCRTKRRWGMRMATASSRCSVLTRTDLPIAITVEHEARITLVGRTLRVMVGNAQVINNFDEGGQDYQGEPAVSSGDPSTGDTDNVDGSAARWRAGYVACCNRILGLVFFRDAQLGIPVARPVARAIAVRTSSTTPIRQSPGLQSSIAFASAEQLGLDVADDINALMIDDARYQWRVHERATASTSHSRRDHRRWPRLPFLSSNGAADLLIAQLNTQGQVVLDLYASGADMGLVGPNDDVDALEIVPLNDEPTAAAMISFARRLSWDSPIPGRLEQRRRDRDCRRRGLHVLHVRPAYKGPVLLSRRCPCADILDLNDDGDVDLGDFNIMVQIFGSTPGF
jgi:hypothetical protein